MELPKDKKSEEVVRALTENQDALYTFLFLQLGNEDASREVLQEANIAIWRKAGQLDTVEHFLPWAKSIASFEIRHFITRRQREEKRIVFDSETADSIGSEMAAVEPGKGPYEEIDYQLLEKCLKQLPSKKNRLVRRRYWDDWPIEKIACEQNESSSSIAVQLYRAREALGNCIRKLRCSFGREETPSPEELARAELFERVFANDPSAFGKIRLFFQETDSSRRAWLENASIHAALRFHRNKLRLAFPGFGLARRNFRPVFLAAAASLALLIGGAAVWFATARNDAVDKHLAPERVFATERPETKTPVAKTSLAQEPLQGQRIVNSAEPYPQTRATENQSTESMDNFEVTTVVPPRQGKEGAMNRVFTRTAAVIAVGAAVLPASVTRADGSCEAKLGSLCVNQTRYWQTAFTNELPVRWQWCDRSNVSYAMLQINGLNASYSTSFTKDAAATDGVYFLPAGKCEDFYTVVLSFYTKEGGMLLQSLTGTVACVQGAATGGSANGITVDASITNAVGRVVSWLRVRRPDAPTANVVIGYKAAWATNGIADAATFTIIRKDGAKQLTASVPPDEGWYAWKVEQGVLKYGWFDISVKFGDAQIAGQAYRPVVGTVVQLK